MNYDKVIKNILPAADTNMADYMVTDEDRNTRLKQPHELTDTHVAPHLRYVMNTASYGVITTCP